LLVEAVRRDHGTEYYVHAPLNRTGNDALSRVAVLRLAREHGFSSLSLVADLGFMLMVRGRLDIPPERWRAILSATAFDEDLSAALDNSEMLVDRFRRVAQIGLLMPRQPLRGERRTYAPCRTEDDFVLLRQARRELLVERSAACEFAEQLPRVIVRCRQLADVSTFVAGWNRVEAGPVEIVDTPHERLRRLHAELTESRRVG
jgi:Lhr-like helicase